MQAGGPKGIGRVDVTGGSVTFDPETGKATLHVSKDANLLTAVLQMGLVFRRSLGPNLLTRAEQNYRIDNGVWTEADEQRWVRDLGRYYRDGMAPNPNLQKAFDDIRKEINSVYPDEANSPFAGRLHPNMRAIFDEMLGGASQLAQEQRAQEVQDEPSVPFKPNKIEAEMPLPNPKPSTITPVTRVTDIFTKLNIAVVAAVLFLIGAAYYIWPTPYRYFKSGPANYRTNRFTGDTQFLDISGWHTYSPPPPTPPAPTPQPVDANDLATISSQCGITAVAPEYGQSKITVRCHNPTNHTLTDIKIEIWGKDSSGNSFNREYLLNADDNPIEPTSDGSFSCNYDGTFLLNSSIKDINWSIDSIDAT